MSGLTEAERAQLSDLFEINRFTALTNAIERIIAAREAAAAQDAAQQVETRVLAVADKWEAQADGNEVARGSRTKVAGYYRKHATELRAALTTPDGTP